MNHRPALTLLAGLLAAVTLWSCASAPSAPVAASAPAQAMTGAAAPVGPSLQATYDALAAGGGRVFALDPARSDVRIYVFRGGRAAKVGHNHVLSAPRFTGFFHQPGSAAAESRFDLEFRLDELEIDRPEHRAGLGAAFASVLSPEAIQGTREHMLGESNLEADKYPFVRIHSLEITGESPRFAARVQVHMHGQSREIWVPLQVEGLPERLSVAGSFVLRQTDFGAQPYSVLGGLIAVKDEVVIDFRLVGGGATK